MLGILQPLFGAIVMAVGYFTLAFGGMIVLMPGPV